MIFKNRAAGGVWADFDTDVRHANPAQASKEWRGAVFDTGMRPSDEALERHAGLPSSEQDGVCRAQIVQAAGILIGKEVRVKIARAGKLVRTSRKAEISR